MPKEIERKFLTTEQLDLSGFVPEYISQGYIASTSKSTVRVRVKNDKGYITVKGHTVGITRPEYEYEIPEKDARELLSQFSLTSLIEKYRYKVTVGSHLWEVDVFCGDNKGLIVAEIELSAEDEWFERPGWLGEEVTYDPRYRNSSLTKTPYCLWNE